MTSSISRRGSRAPSAPFGPLSTVRYTVNGVDFDMVRVPPGRFVDGEGPTRRELLVSRPFEIGITLVTQALWRAVMDSSPSFFKTEDRPADNISYDDVQAFLARLFTFGLTGFRLTTEAEWGWAARCGAPTRWSGADRAKLVAVAGARRTEPVAVLYPDSAGIFDQSGNVMEWVADWHQGSPEPGLDQRGPASGPYRVNRGGNWCSDLNFARVAARSRNFPASRNDGLFGFRLLRITP